MSFTADQITTILGFIFFTISEILPFLNIASNGLLHILSVGFSGAFKSQDSDVQLAQNLIQSKKYANIVNNISMNPKLYDLINKICSDPTLLSNVNNITNNPDLLNGIVTLQNVNNLKLSQESIDAIKPLMIRIEP
jgi:hypothetical protein